MEKEIRDNYHSSFPDKGVASQKWLISKLNSLPPDDARAVVCQIVNSERFTDTFRDSRLRGWPVGVLPVVISKAVKIAGVITSTQVIFDNIRPGKFRKHPEVSVEQYRHLQDALDYGEVLLEPPGRAKQGGRNTLLIHFCDGGDWWRYVVNIEIDKLTLLTVFRGSNIARQKVLKRMGLVVIKAWDEDVWKKKPGA